MCEENDVEQLSDTLTLKISYLLLGVRGKHISIPFLVWVWESIRKVDIRIVTRYQFRY
jgi:hypothetical protein